MKQLAAILLVAACGTTQPGPDFVTKTAPPGVCGMVETHVVGIYSAPGGVATVDLERPGDHALVLSAYEATSWTITLGDGANLLHVYAVGYHGQTVTIPPNADGTVADLITDSNDADGTYSCGYQYAGTAECDTSALLLLSSAKIHHEPTTFHGCYSATSWTIGEDLKTTSDCASFPSAVTQDDWIGGCDASANSSDSCGGPS